LAFGDTQSIGELFSYGVVRAMQDYKKTIPELPTLLAEVFHMKHGKDAYPYSNRKLIPIITWALHKTPVLIENVHMVALLSVAVTIGTLIEKLTTIVANKGVVETKYDNYPSFITLRKLAIKYYGNLTNISTVIEVCTLTPPCSAILAHNKDNNTNTLSIDSRILVAQTLKQIVYDFLYLSDIGISAMRFAEECGSMLLDIVPLSKYTIKETEGNRTKKRKAKSMEEVLSLSCAMIEQIV